jgi:hypothetical protein
MRLALIAMSTVLALSGAAPARAQAIDFGDDSGEFARDGQCDDRRFRGATMANILGITEIGRDATDCQRGYEAGVLELWQPGAAQAATDCAVISFGDDSSDFARDGQCDDIRFEGIGAAELLIRPAPRPHRDPPGQADQVHGGEFGARALRPVVVKRLQPRVERLVEAPRRPRPPRRPPA